ncbi:hypothetical protein IQ266_07775 [filamentous cyanobacterium LEGE 11480]|uniref:Uncharacterized protein n=1 Tax=Romeriopsis navalis LEGE 11480 TaxID=2777977 RepID=A0A928Z1R6_9CYAN|nr:hypothetical protein [Romeriopsis navalis]MBE9029626.1 hypothetical protein [Romeriopsis navalis LEGE 11480]
MRQGTQGVPEVLAKGGLNYDLAMDGTIVYTNGSEIFRLVPGGQPEQLCAGKLVESLVMRAA